MWNNLRSNVNNNNATIVRSQQLFIRHEIKLSPVVPTTSIAEVFTPLTLGHDNFNALKTPTIYMC